MAGNYFQFLSSAISGIAHRNDEFSLDFYVNMGKLSLPMSMNPTIVIAEYLAKQAERLKIRETEVCKMAGISPSYISKAKSGLPLEIPEDKLKKLAAVLGLDVAKIYGHLELPEPNWLKDATKNTLFPGEPPIQLRFPYIATVPDHAWPLLAREIFRAFNIELLDEPLSLAEHIKCMENVEEGKVNTATVMPYDWVHKPECQKFKPVALSHLYHGYALVGLKSRTFRSLDGSISDGGSMDGSSALANLFVLLAELRYNDVLCESRFNSKGSIAYYDKGGLEFVKKLIEIARADERSKMMLDNLELNDELPQVTTASLTFLEPLSAPIASGFDLVVGHALTLAMALSSENYKVFANFRHLQSATEHFKKPDQRKHFGTIVDTLRKPVVFALNIPNDWDRDEKVAMKCLRICGAVNQASKRLFKALTQELIVELGALLQSQVKTKINTTKLREAWDASYDFKTAAEGLEYMSKNEKLEPANSIMTRLLDYEGLAELHLKSPEPSPETDVAKIHFANGNYFDACEALKVNQPITTTTTK